LAHNGLEAALRCTTVCSFQQRVGALRVFCAQRERIGASQGGRLWDAFFLRKICRAPV